MRMGEYPTPRQAQPVGFTRILLPANGAYRKRMKPASRRRSTGPSRQRWDAKLSSRERQVAQCVVRGISNKDVAEELEISEKTVEKHVSQIFRKLGFRSRAQLAVYVAKACFPTAALR